jgi:hypothetical protein
MNGELLFPNSEAVAEPEAGRTLIGLVATTRGSILPSAVGMHKRPEQSLGCKFKTRQIKDN